MLLFFSLLLDSVFQDSNEIKWALPGGVSRFRSSEE
jgi:hypothetical protein